MNSIILRKQFVVLSEASVKVRSHLNCKVIELLKVSVDANVVICRQITE